MLPARDVNGLINCVKKLRNSKKDNPIRVSIILFSFIKYQKISINLFVKLFF